MVQSQPALLADRVRVPVAAVSYASFVTGAVTLVWLATRLGAGREAQQPIGAQQFTVAPVTAWQLLGAIGVIVLLCRVGGLLARLLGQSRVVGEIIIGVLIGPSVLGAIAPEMLHKLFPLELVSQLSVLADLGVVFFAFGLGLEVDMAGLRRQSHTALWVSHVSIAVPFVSGCFLALVLRGELGPNGSFTAFCLFLGAAMSITAFPVLGRILEDNGLTRTAMGRLVIVCAAVDDVTAWIGLSLVVAVARGHGAVPTLRMVALGAALAVAVLKVARPFLARTMASVEGASSTALLAGFALLAAAVSDWIGLHAIFGAFLAGCAIPRQEGVRRELQRMGPLVDGVLLPLFFVIAGLQVDLRRLVHHPEELVPAALILAVAVAGKLGGSALAAYLTGSSRRDALAIGVLMNTRGLTELVVLQVGLQLGVLRVPLYSLLVLMALATTAMAGPLLRALGVTAENRPDSADENSREAACR